MILNEYFTDAELVCRCGCGLMPRRSSVERLYLLRILLGLPLRITSSARCVAYNKQIGGAKESKHVLCCAFDTQIIPVNSHRKHEFELVRLAIICGFRGIGISNNSFVHIDDGTRESAEIWTY